MQTIGAKIELQGEAQFKAGLDNIVQQSKTLAAELKNVSSSFDKTASSQEKARAKMDVLNRQIETQRTYIDKLNQKYGLQKQKLDEIGAEYQKVAAEQGANSREAQKLATEYTRQETALGKTAEKINKAETALHGMENELNATETELRELEAAAQGLTIGEKFEQAAEKVKAAGEKVQQFGQGMTNAGKTLSAGITAPLVAVGTKGVQAFAEVDKTMALTNKTMGNTSAEAKLLNDAMKDAASNSTFGMSDAATATLNFARAGLDAKQSAAALAPAMNLAAGEGGELDTVSSGLVATINGFHGSFEDAGHYADVFAAACNNSALDVNSLSGAMSVAAPIFSSAGYSVNDAALYMGIMANNGIEADKAANSLKTGIARLVSPAKEGAEMMDKLGISVTNSDGTMKSSTQVQYELHDAFSKLSESEQIAAASAIFGKNQMAPWLALINTAPEEVSNLNVELEGASISVDSFAEQLGKSGLSIDTMKANMEKLGVSSEDFDEAVKISGGDAEDFADTLLEWTNPGVKASDVTKALGGNLDDLQTAMDGAKGTTDEMAEAMMSGFGGGMERLKSTLDVLVTTIGERLAPYVQLAADKIQDLADKFNALSPEQQETILKIAALAAAIGPLLVVGGKLTVGIGKVMTAAPQIVKGVTSVAGVFPKVGSAITKVGGVFKTVGAAIMAHPVLAIAAVIAGIIAAVVAHFVHLYKTNDEFREKVDNAFNSIKETIHNVIEAVKAKFEEWHNKFEETKAKVQHFFDHVKFIFDNLDVIIALSMANIVAAIVEKWEEVKQKASEKVQAMKDAVQQKIDALKEAVTTKFEEVKGAIQQKVDNIKEKVTNTFETAKTNVVEKVTTLKTNVTNLFEGIKSSIQQKVDTVKSNVTNVFETIKSTISEKITTAKNTVTSMFDGMKTGVSNAIDKIKSTVQTMLDKVNDVKDGIKNAIDKIKSFFSDLKLKIPQPSLPKLPHFSLKTKSKDILGQTITYPAGFDVSWYDKGGVFRSPSIIGVGEKRPEFVGALDDLRKIVREETAHNDINIVVNAAPGQDEKAIADYVYNKLNNTLRRETLYA